MKLFVLASLILFPLGGILCAMENDQNAGTKAVEILTQTFPLRNKLNYLGKSIATLNGQIDEKQKKAFKMHHEDVKKALDTVSKLCNNVNASLLSKEKPEDIQKLLEQAQTTLKLAQKELNHYERSFTNHVKEINGAKL